MEQAEFKQCACQKYFFENPIKREDKTHGKNYRTLIPQNRRSNIRDTIEQFYFFSPDEAFLFLKDNSAGIFLEPRLKAIHVIHFKLKKIK